jgi:hypothetical protein
MSGTHFKGPVVVAGVEVISATGQVTADIAATAESIGVAEAAESVKTQCVQKVGGTIATTGNTDEYVVAPVDGILTSADVSPLVALATDDTNYITFSVTNLGQAGAGSAAMLAASAANTTKITGGAALAINTKRALTLHGTAGNLVVAKGDLLLIRAAASGTLANTVTRPVYQVCFKKTA